VSGAGDERSLSRRQDVRALMADLAGIADMSAFGLPILGARSSHSSLSPAPAPEHSGGGFRFVTIRSSPLFKKKIDAPSTTHYRLVSRALARVICSSLVIASITAKDVLAQVQSNWFEGQSIGDSFGVQIKGWHINPATLDTIKAAGFGFIRTGFGWRYIEQPVGAYAWAEADERIAQIRARKLKSIFTLGGGHPAYTPEVVTPLDPTNSKSTSKLLSPPVSSAAVDGFLRFVAAMVQRYQGEDVVWEIWNEPDLDQFWPPRPSATAYIKLATETCKTIRKVAPSAKVIGPGTAEMPGRRVNGFVSTVIRSNLMSCLDGVSFHSYRFEKGSPPKSPESVINDNAAAISFIDKYSSKRLPSICSEWGYNTLAVSLERQADYVLRTHLANLLSGVSATTWYEWRDSMVGADDPEAHFGLIDYGGQDKPAARSVKDVLSVIRNDKIERRLATESDLDYVVLLSSASGAKRLLFWTTRNGPLNHLFIKTPAETRPITSRPQVVNLNHGLPDFSIVFSKAP
jgi:Cellulase (glycosyl hydrolase family 5)